MEDVELQSATGGTVKSSDTNKALRISSMTLAPGQVQIIPSTVSTPMDIMNSLIGLRVIVKFDGPLPKNKPKQLVLPSQKPKEQYD